MTGTAAAGKTGDPAEEPPIQDDCKELDQDNQNARYQLWLKTDDQTLMGENVKVSRT